MTRRLGRSLRRAARWLRARIRRLWARLRQQPLHEEKRGEDQTILMEGGIPSTSAVGTPTVTTTLEERVELLGRQLHELGQHVDQLAATARADLAEEAARRDEGYQQLGGQLAGHGEEHRRGEQRMLGLDWKGFWLLVPGVILTTWPTELARWVNGVLD